MDSTSESELTEPLHVVLYEPEIHWNTGNAGRTCLAAGARLHLIAPLGFSLETKEVRRAGLDYWDRVPLSVWSGWSAFERVLPSLGAPVFLTTRADRTIWDAPLAEAAVLVFGPETRGLPDPLLERYRAASARIPMQPESIRSLNLSTAVGIVVWETLRQRRER